MFQNPYINTNRAITATAVAAAVAEGAVGVPYVLAASAVQVNTTGDTNENTLATITIPAGAMGARGILRVSTQWSWNNSATSKTIRWRLGGIGGTAFLAVAATTTVSDRDQRWVQNRNSQSSQIGGQATSSTAFGPSTTAIVTSAIDTSASTTIVITGQLALLTDNVALESYIVEIIKMT